MTCRCTVLTLLTIEAQSLTNPPATDPSLRQDGAKMRSLVVVLTAALCIADAEARDLPVERMYDAPALHGPTLRQPRFSPDGRLVTYLRAREDAATVSDLWAYDIARGDHRLLVDSRALVPVEARLSAEEEARRERQRIASLRGIVEYQWAPDSKALLVPLDGDLYRYDLTRPAAEAVRRLTKTEAYETDAKFSPRGRYVSFIRDQDIYAIELATGRERRLTTGGGGTISHGVAEFIAQEEMGRDTGYWWSPDDAHVAYARVDESPVAEIERFEVGQRGIEVLRQRYPATGQANAKVTLAILALDTGNVAWADLGAEDQYLPRVDWFPEGDRLVVQRQSRDQKRLDVVAFPASGGTGQVLWAEQSDTWIDLHEDLHFLPARKEILWVSARSGHDHLYRYGYDGALKGAVTAGEWDVIGESGPAVRGIDEQRGKVYFIATLKSPLERHLYSADLDTGAAREPVALTSGEGLNAISMPKDARRFLRVYSDPGQPPQFSLHDATGRRLAWLVENRIVAGHPYAPYLDRHVPPEFGTIPAADGTLLHYKVNKPAGYQAGRRYPAVLMVYGGPMGQAVTKHWASYPTDQLFTQRGYVVFELDNRGTGARGRKFDETLYRRLGGVEVEDQLKGVAWLKSQPYVDPVRVGAFGWSYGGYMTLMLLAQSPGTFKAGVAGAPVTDFSLYDTHYTERYLGTPQENPEGYRLSNVMTYAGAIRDRLMIIHGMADDNVLFTNTTLLIPALVKSGQPFEVVPYPGMARAKAVTMRSG